MVLSAAEMFHARVHAMAEDGEVPAAGSVWFAPKKIEYSRLVEMTAKTGCDIVDFLTVKNGVHIVAEIAQVQVGQEVRYYQHG
jgi:hypothetical protein